MADTPSAILLLRLQSTGSNTNLWGGYLNTALQTLEQAAKGFQSLAVSGDAAVSWANYAAGNSGQAARLKLTGALSASATLIFPAYQNALSVENAAGAAVTIKCAAGTGVTLAHGRSADLYCDGTDYFNAAPTVFPAGASVTMGGALTVTGKISGVTAGTAATDAVNKAQMEATVAAGAIPGAPGTVKVGPATNSLYLLQALQASGAVTIAESGDSLTFEVAPGGYADGGRKDAPFTALSGHAYAVTSGCTFFLDPDPPDGAKMRVALFNTHAVYEMDPNGKTINGRPFALGGIQGGQTFELTYDASLGDWE